MQKVMLITRKETNTSVLHGLVMRLRAIGYSFDIVSSIEELDSAHIKEQKVCLLAIGSQKEDEELYEVASKAKEINPSMEILAVFFGKLHFDSRNLYKFNVDRIYQYPLEDELIINSLIEKQPVALENHQLDLSVMARVSVMEINAEEALPFGLYIYLPANRKIIPYCHKEVPVAGEMLEKFRENSHYSLYIKKNELPQYYRYYANRISEKASLLSRPEYKKEMTFQLKSLMSGFFDNSKSLDPKEASELMENLSKMVDQVQDPDGDKKELIRKVNQVISQQYSSYSHVQNVGTYCAIFGMLCGLKEVQSLKLGGMLHDLGMLEISFDVRNKETSEMTLKEFGLFQRHPQAAIELLKDKQVAIPKVVEEMIIQHHEVPDGSGFPYGLKSDKISEYAKVCAFANTFDQLTSVREGIKQLSPFEAMCRISGLDGGEPDPVFELEFHSDIIEAFTGEDPREFLASSKTKVESDSELEKSSADEISPEETGKKSVASHEVEDREEISSYSISQNIVKTAPDNCGQ